MKNDVSPELIRKYLDGQCTPQEAALVTDWYNSFEDEEDPALVLTDSQQDELKKHIRERVKFNIDVQNQKDEKKSHLKRNLIYYLSGAAALVLIVSRLILLNHKEPAYSYNVSAEEQVLVKNLTQSIQKQVLPDSSIVWLSPRTTLKFPRKFTGDRREVEMTGETFFEVYKDKAHPFIIYSGGVITRVLGTSFRIRAYSGTPSTEVSVVTGKVSVQIPMQDNSEVMLLPKQRVVYFKEQNLLKQDIKLIPALRMWDKASVSFDNAPLSEVINTLNKKFGVTITVGNEELLDYRLNADFSDQNLPDILEMLNKSLKVSYVIYDQEIILNTKPTH